MKLNIPTALAAVLALGAGVLQVLNQTNDLHLDPTWKPYLTVALVFLTGIGISPLVHDAFRNALHLSLGATTVITAITSALAVAATTLSISADAKGWIQFVLTVLAGLGFGAAGGAATTIAPANLR